MLRYLALAVAILFFAAPNAVAQRPNVVLIAVDDLNDWIGVLGGHPQAKTPGMDGLANQGVLFTNAHCQSPVCNPSRASLMTGLFPSTSGIYFLNPDLAESPVAQKSTLLPKRFQQEGYNVNGAGKLFHGGQSRKYWPDWRNFGGASWPRQTPKLAPFKGHPLWDWGIVPESDVDSPDYNTASWAIEQLHQPHSEPFLMGVGFSRPHVPQYASKKWFDLYPNDSLQLPKSLQDDLNDVPEYGVDITRLKHIAPTHQWVTDNDQWKPLVRSYLACVSFVDSQVQRVVEAINQSPHRDNTYIVLFSDHGFHLGEKERYAKRSLWRDSTRVPMIISGPGIKPGVCEAPVQLIDLYPTLLDLCDMKPSVKLEGHSLRPILQNPSADWKHHARCSFGPGNYAIVSRDYRYIHYSDGSEELYHSQTDEHEWKNLIGIKAHDAALAELRRQVPEQRHAVLGKGSTGHQSFSATEAKWNAAK